MSNEVLCLLQNYQIILLLSMININNAKVIICLILCTCVRLILHTHFTWYHNFDMCIHVYDYDYNNITQSHISWYHNFNMCTIGSVQNNMWKSLTPKMPQRILRSIIRLPLPNICTLMNTHLLQVLLINAFIYTQCHQCNLIKTTFNGGSNYFDR